MRRVDVARIAAVLLAHRRRHADDFAHHAVRAHQARRAERDVRDGNVASGHEEVGDVARIEAAVRHGIRPNLLVEGVGLERLAGELGFRGRLRQMAEQFASSIVVSIHGRTGNAASPFASPAYHWTDEPIVAMSAFSGADGSFVSERASRPMR